MASYAFMIFDCLCIYTDFSQSMGTVYFLVILVSVLPNGFGRKGFLDPNSFTAPVVKMLRHAGYKYMMEHFEKYVTVTSTQVDPIKERDKRMSRLKNRLQARMAVVNNMAETLFGASANFGYSDVGFSRNYEDCCSIRLQNLPVSQISPTYKRRIDSAKSCYFRPPSVDQDAKYPNRKFADDFQVESMKYVEALEQPLIFAVTFQTGLQFTYPARPFATRSCDGSAETDPRYFEEFLLAASPKDKLVLIFLDVSADMALKEIEGERTLYDLAEHLVSIILKGLHNTDEVALVTFPELTSVPVGEDCFRLGFVPMNGQLGNNILLFLERIEDQLPPSDQISYFQALTTGFDFLQSSPSLVRKETVIFFITGEKGTGEPHTEWPKAIPTNVTWPIPPTSFIYALGQSVSSLFDLGILRTALSRLDDSSQVQIQTDIASFAMVTEAVSFYYQFLSGAEDNVFVSIPYPTPGTKSRLTVLMSKAVVESSTGNLIAVVSGSFSILDIMGELNEFDTYHFMTTLPEGYVMYHPHYGPSYADSSMIKQTSIFSLESHPDVAAILEDMLNGSRISITVEVPFYMKRGADYLEGAVRRMRNLTYSCRHITVASHAWGFCYVQPHNYTRYSVRLNYEPTLHFNYHRLDLLESNMTNKDACQYFASSTLKDHSLVYLDPRAYVNPFVQYFRSEDRRDLADLIKVVTKEKTNDLLLHSVLNDIEITSFLDPEWTKARLSHQLLSYPVMQTVYTRHGMHRTYPGFTGLQNVDFSLDVKAIRTWAYPNLYIVHPPELALHSIGYTVFLSKAIQIPGTDYIYGYSGMAVTLHYFQLLVELYFYKDCRDREKYTCFVMNSAGTVVTHPMWVDANWSVTPAVSNVHVVGIEPGVARHMLVHGLMVKKKCTRVHADMSSIEYHYVVDFEEQDFSQVGNAWYKAVHVRDTDIYIIQRQNGKTYSFNSCTCRYAEASLPECLFAGNKTCECPCYAPIPQLCDRPLTGDDDICLTPFPNPNIVRQPWRILEKTVLPDCSGWTCHRGNSRRACQAINTCRWCDRTQTGALLDTPFCELYSQCYFGQFQRRLADDLLGGSTFRSLAVILSLLLVIFTIPVVSTVYFIIIFRRRSRRHREMKAKRDAALDQHIQGLEELLSGEATQASGDSDSRPVSQDSGEYAVRRRAVLTAARKNQVLFAPTTSEQVLAAASSTMLEVPRSKRRDVLGETFASGGSQSSLSVKEHVGRAQSQRSSSVDRDKQSRTGILSMHSTDRDGQGRAGVSNTQYVDKAALLSRSGTGILKSPRSTSQPLYAVVDNPSPQTGGNDKPWTENVVSWTEKRHYSSQRKSPSSRDPASDDVGLRTTSTTFDVQSRGHVSMNPSEKSGPLRSLAAGSLSLVSAPQSAHTLPYRPPRKKKRGARIDPSELDWETKL